MDDRPASRVETTAAFIRGRIGSRALARLPAPLGAGAGREA